MELEKQSGLKNYLKKLNIL